MRNTPLLQASAPARMQQGFSLFEMVLVLVILSIAAAVGAQLMGAGFQVYFTGRDNLGVDAQARLALERLTRELRAVRVGSGLSLLPAYEANFIGVDGTTVRYCLGAVNGCPGAAGELMRNGQVLAGGISGLSFVYTRQNGTVTTDPDEVLYISLRFTATQGGIVSPYQATVSPRN